MENNKKNKEQLNSLKKAVQNDLVVIVYDHCSAHPNCDGDFAVFNINSRNVNFG